MQKSSCCYLIILISDLFAVDEFQHLRHIAFVGIELLESVHVVGHNFYPPIICLVNHKID